MSQNGIHLFTEAELGAALALVGTPESAASVAAELYALPDEEQRCYNWINTTLMLLSCVSDDLARRVLENFGDTPAARARHEAERESGREWIGQRSGKPKIVWVLDDVVNDARQDIAFMQAFRSAEARRQGTNYIALFSEPELQDALSAVSAPETSAAVATETYALPPEEQVELDWTDLALGLRASVSGDFAVRIEKAFGVTEDRRELLRQMVDVFRELIASGELTNAGVRLNVHTVVRRR